MDWQAFLFLTAVFLTLFILRQRADPARKSAARNFLWFSIFLMSIYIWWNELWLVALWAFLLALVLSILFWALIGRYNPVSSSDDIKVLGLDD